MATLPNTNNRAACGAVSGRFHGLPTFEVHESVIGRSEWKNDLGGNVGHSGIDSRLNVESSVLE
jgi:hypothetical protein